MESDEGHYSNKGSYTGVLGLLEKSVCIDFILKDCEK